MKEKLIKLLNNSYSPYSNYRVAAIVRMKDGKEFSGELYVMCGDSNKISTCCFICRQVISEFFNENDEIICMDKLGNELKLKVKDLCPYPFTEDDLK